MKELHHIIGYCVAVVALLLVGTLVFVALALRQDARLLTRPREVPGREIRLRFRQLVGEQLPAKIRVPRAIVDSGRQTAMFVQFEIDPEDINDVLTMFGEAKVRILDADDLADLKNSQASLFPDVSHWQSELGILLYDQGSLESVEIVESPPAKILIDRQRNTVYIFVKTLPL